MAKGARVDNKLRKRLKERIGQRVRSGSVEVPVLPHIAAEVLTLTGDPSASARDFVGLLEHDSQLTARLLKIANSPVYAGRVEVASIQRAVVTVGMRTLRDLALSVAMNERVFRSKRFSEHMHRIWEHSLAVAYITQEIARTRRLDAEHAFLGGLLHDIGKTLLLETLDGLAREMGGEIEFSDDIVDDVLRDYHTAVGGLMAKVWNFSGGLGEAIRLHHDFDAAQQDRQLALLINVADDFATTLGLAGYANAEPFDITTRPGLLAMDFSPEEIRALLVSLPTLTRSLIASFG